MEQEELYILIERDEEFTNIFGIFDTYQEAVKHMNNLKIYNKPNGVLRILVFKKNMYYNDLEHEADLFEER